MHKNRSKSALSNAGSGLQCFVLQAQTTLRTPIKLQISKVWCSLVVLSFPSVICQVAPPDARRGNTLVKVFGLFGKVQHESKLVAAQCCNLNGNLSLQS